MVQLPLMQFEKPCTIVEFDTLIPVTELLHPFNIILLTAVFPVIKLFEPLPINDDVASKKLHCPLVIVLYVPLAKFPSPVKIKFDMSTKP